MKIEKNVPVPESTGRPGRPLRRPFDKMEPGDSVFFPGEKTGSPNYDSAKKYFRRHNKKFVARAYPDGLRIWRTA